MAYTFQGQDIVAPFRLSSNEPVFSADSVNLKVRRVRQGSQRWEMEFKVVMTDATNTFADMITTFHDKVTLEMPQLNVRGEVISSGTCTTTVSTAGVQATGVSTVAIAGMTSGTTIKKGRFVQFDSYDKMYMVTADVTANASGQATLPIYPDLQATVADGVELFYKDSDSITFNAYRDISNTQGITYTDGILSDLGTITLIEAL
jgi:hypothetical protein